MVLHARHAQLTAGQLFGIWLEIVAEMSLLRRDAGPSPSLEDAQAFLEVADREQALAIAFQLARNWEAGAN